MINIEKKGYLFFQNISGTWNLRPVTLDASKGLLSYSAVAFSNKSLRKTFDVSNGELVLRSEKEIGRPYGFVIAGDVTSSTESFDLHSWVGADSKMGRALYLATENQDDYESWISVFRRALKSFAVVNPQSPVSSNSNICDGHIYIMNKFGVWHSRFISINLNSYTLTCYSQYNKSHGTSCKANLKDSYVEVLTDVGRKYAFAVFGEKFKATVKNWEDLNPSFEIGHAKSRTLICAADDSSSFDRWIRAFKICSGRANDPPGSPGKERRRVSIVNSGVDTLQDTLLMRLKDGSWVSRQVIFNPNIGVLAYFEHLKSCCSGVELKGTVSVCRAHIEVLSDSDFGKPNTFAVFGDDLSPSAPDSEEFNGSFESDYPDSRTLFFSAADAVISRRWSDSLTLCVEKFKVEVPVIVKPNNSPSSSDKSQTEERVFFTESEISWNGEIFVLGRSGDWMKVQITLLPQSNLLEFCEIEGDDHHGTITFGGAFMQKLPSEDFGEFTFAVFGESISSPDESSKSLLNESLEEGYPNSKTLIFSCTDKDQFDNWYEKFVKCLTVTKSDISPVKAEVIAESGTSSNRASSYVLGTEDKLKSAAFTSISTPNNNEQMSISDSVNREDSKTVKSRSASVSSADSDTKPMPGQALFSSPGRASPRAHAMLEKFRSPRKSVQFATNFVSSNDEDLKIRVEQQKERIEQLEIELDEIADCVLEEMDKLEASKQVEIAELQQRVWVLETENVDLKRKEKYSDIIPRILTKGKDAEAISLVNDLRSQLDNSAVLYQTQLSKNEALLRELEVLKIEVPKLQQLCEQKTKQFEEGLVSYKLLEESNRNFLAEINKMREIDAANQQLFRDLSPQKQAGKASSFSPVKSSLDFSNLEDVSSCRAEECTAVRKVELDKLKNAFQSLEQQVVNLKNENKNLVQKTVSSLSRNDNNSLKLQQIESSKVDLGKRISNLEDIIKNLEEELEKSYEAKKALEISYGSFKSREGDMKAEITQLREECKRMQYEMSLCLTLDADIKTSQDLQLSLSALRSEIEAEKQNYEKCELEWQLGTNDRYEQAIALKNREDAVSNKELEYVQKDLTIQTLEGRLSEIQKVVESLQLELTKRSEDCAVLQVDYELKISQFLSVIEQQHKELETAEYNISVFDRLKVKMGDLENTLAEKDRIVNENSIEIGKLREEFKRIEKEKLDLIATNTEDINKFSEKKNEYLQKLSMYEGTVRDMMGNEATLTATVAALNITVAEQRAALEDSAQIIEKKTREVVENNCTIDELMAKMVSLNLQNQTILSQIEDYKGQLQAVDYNTLNTLKSSLAQSKAEYEKLISEYNKLKDENARVSMENSEKSKEIERLVSCNTILENSLAKVNALEGELRSKIFDLELSLESTVRELKLTREEARVAANSCNNESLTQKIKEDSAQLQMKDSKIKEQDEEICNLMLQLDDWKSRDQSNSTNNAIAEEKQKLLDAYLLKIKGLSSDNKELTLKISTLENEMDILNKEKVGLVDEIATLKMSVSEKTNALSERDTRFAAASEMYEKLQTAYNELRAKRRTSISLTSDSPSAKTSNTEDLEAELKDLKQKISFISQERDKREMELVSGFNETYRKVEEYHKSQEAVHTEEFAALQEKYKQSQRELSNCRNELDSSQKEISFMKLFMEEKPKQDSPVQVHNDSSVQLENLQKRVEELQEHNNEQRVSLENSVLSTKKLEEQLLLSADKCNKYAASEIQLNREIQTLNAALLEKNAANRNLEETVSMLSKNEASASQIRDLQDKNAFAERVIREKDNLINRKEKEIEGLNVANNELKLKLGEAVSAYVNYQKDMETSIDKSIGEFELYKQEENDRTKFIISGLENKIKSLEEALEDTKKVRTTAVSPNVVPRASGNPWVSKFNITPRSRVAPVSPKATSARMETKEVEKVSEKSAVTTPRGISRPLIKETMTKEIPASPRVSLKRDGEGKTVADMQGRMQDLFGIINQLNGELLTMKSAYKQLANSKANRKFMKQRVEISHPWEDKSTPTATRTNFHESDVVVPVTVDKHENIQQNEQIGEDEEIFTIIGAKVISK